MGCQALKGRNRLDSLPTGLRALANRDFIYLVLVLSSEPST